MLSSTQGSSCHHPPQDRVQGRGEAAKDDHARTRHSQRNRAPSIASLEPQGSCEAARRISGAARRKRGRSLDPAAVEGERSTRVQRAEDAGSVSRSPSSGPRAPRQSPILFEKEDGEKSEQGSRSSLSESEQRAGCRARQDAWSLLDKQFELFLASELVAGLDRRLPDAIGKVAKIFVDEPKAFVVGTFSNLNGDLLPLPRAYLSVEDMRDLYVESGIGFHRRNIIGLTQTLKSCGVWSKYTLGCSA